MIGPVLAPIMAVFAVVAEILATVTAVFLFVLQVFTLVKEVLAFVARSAVVVLIPAIFPLVAQILPLVAQVFTAIMEVFAFVAKVFAAIRAGERRPGRKRRPRFCGTACVVAADVVRTAVAGLVCVGLPGIVSPRMVRVMGMRPVRRKGGPLRSGFRAASRRLIALLVVPVGVAVAIGVAVTGPVAISAWTAPIPTTRRTLPSWSAGASLATAVGFTSASATSTAPFAGAVGDCHYTHCRQKIGGHDPSDPFHDAYP
jgi:hypothetical protein